MLKSVSKHKATHFASGVLLALALISTPVMSTAWSHQDFKLSLDKSESVSREAQTETHPSSVAAELCTPLLTTNQHISNTFSVDRSQRTAGKVAALGMILGARFALEQQDDREADAVMNITLERHVLKSKPAMFSAHSIAAYRQCHKEVYLRYASRH